MEDWQALADYVSDELLDQRLTWTALSERGPIGQTTLRMIRYATYRPHPDNWAKLRVMESALGWEPGSVHRIVYEHKGPLRKPDLDKAYIDHVWPLLTPKARQRLRAAAEKEDRDPTKTKQTPKIV